MPWLCLFSVATVVSLVALSFKLKAAREQFRSRRLDFEFDACPIGEAAERAKKLRIYRKRYKKTARMIELTYTSMLVGMAECIPLGVLQVALFWRHTC